MKLLSTSLFSVAVISSGVQGAGFFENLKNKFCSRDCRCAGNWVMNVSSWEEPDTMGALKLMKGPVTLKIAVAEEDPKTLTGSMDMYNSLAFVLATPEGKTFCDKEVTLTAGSTSKRLYPFSALAKNEGKVSTLLLNQLTRYECNCEQGLLTLASPAASLSFYKEVVEADQVAAQA